MGKRRYYDADEEEYLERKIRRLERKKSKIRHKHRRRSYSLTSSHRSSRSRDREYVDYREDDHIDMDEQSWQEDSRNEESQMDDEVIIDLVNAPRGSALDSPDNAVGLQSVIMRPHSDGPAPPLLAPAPALRAPTPAPVPAPATAPAPAPAPMPTPAPTSGSADPCVDSFAPSTSTQLIPELEPDILCLLGDEPVAEEKFGPSIQKDVAYRWSDILVNGLKEEVIKDIVKSYEIPENLKLATAPTLNAEIKAACNENFLKRDNILVEKQKLLASVITAVGNTVSSVLKTDSKEDDFKNQILKSLSDTGRLLCHLHFSETQTRRNFLLTVLNKDVRDNIKDLKRDNSLFGKDLQENLKSMKAITKTGAELKPPVTKPKFQPRNRQAEPSTSRALNWRGQPPPAAPAQPRRTYPRTSSTRGGRRPPPPPRRQSDRRAPPSHSRSWRR